MSPSTPKHLSKSEDPSRLYGQQAAPGRHLTTSPTQLRKRSSSIPILGPASWSGTNNTNWMTDYNIKVPPSNADWQRGVRSTAYQLSPGLLSILLYRHNQALLHLQDRITARHNGPIEVQQRHNGGSNAALGSSPQSNTLA